MLCVLIPCLALLPLPLLAQALDAFRKSEYKFKELLVALVKLREFPEPRRVVNVADHH